MTLMCKESTLKEINNLGKKYGDPKRQEALLYHVKNCSSYVVSPNDNEHWLCGSTIVTHWAHDTGYSRKYYGLAFPDNFESWSFHNDELAGEAFDSHHELENY